MTRPALGRRRGHAVRLAAAALVLAACSAPEGGEQAAPAPSTGSATLAAGAADAAAPGALTLPFDAYRLTGDDHDLLDRAHRELLRRCMARLGLGRPLRTMPPAVSGARLAEHARRYGVIEAAVAREHGYHYPATAADRAGPARWEAWEASLTPRERAALDGTGGEPGCHDRAVGDLAAAVPRDDLRWLEGQNFRTVEESAKAAPVRRARELWRACMSRAGFRYPTPQDAISDPRWNLDAPVITSQERATAQADVACKRESGLVQAWYHAEAELQRTLVRAEAARLTRLLKAKQTRLNKACRVLTGGTP
ncbi:hypothetical protein [Bailinhaonella thermotolerans]|uniref:Lipoprotein n=1 Tax=Bailinhaonella thermotolerans TaxID=1070861 RepID=A0A3A4APS7_9ACTN|nr:hypothetical protein [Bailinhaonella thermotolerans]RJL23288.1 hypothetical protein D5H75_33545 [Bailinhaonella thermotolerans]